MHAQAEALNGAQLQGVRKLRMTGIHNVGMSIDMAGWKNMDWSVLVFYEVGSSRNRINASLGAGYKMVVPLQQTSVSMLGHYVPVDLGIKCNYYSWNLNSAYVGLNGIYHICVSNRDLYDSFFALSGCLGVRFKMLDIRVEYTYDLSPQFNQKYIYENPNYDFAALHASIYERMQLGIRLAYYFTLGL